MTTGKTSPCYRCRVQVPADDIEWLEMRSQHKETKMLLCPECFLSCREVFIQWKENDKPNNSLPENNQ